MGFLWNKLLPASIFLKLKAAAAIKRLIVSYATELPYKFSFGAPEKRTEYTVSRQRNGYELEGHVLRRVYYDNQVGSIGQSLYTDGQWHTTANLPPGAQIMQFKDIKTALEAAKNDALQKGLKELTSSDEISLPHSAAVSPNVGYRPEFRLHA